MGSGGRLSHPSSKFHSRPNRNRIRIGAPEMIYGPNAQRQIIFYAGLGLIVGVIVVIALKGLGIA